MKKLILNETAAIILASLLISIEIIIALSLYITRYWKYTGISSAILLFIFTTVVLWGKLSGRITECPCFGKFFGGEIGIKLIIRNIILIMWSLILAINSNYSKQVFEQTL